MKPAPKHDFKVGDHVELSAKGLTEDPSGKPAQLLRIGWPNEFLVADILEEDGSVRLCLDPCCGWMMKSDRNGEQACQGHPAEHFRPLQKNILEEGGASPREEEEGKESEAESVSEAKADGDGRFTAFNIDGEEVFSVEFGDGERDKKHRASIKLPGGKTIDVIGREAKLLNDLILTKLKLG